VVDSAPTFFLVPGSVSTNPAYMTTAYGLRPVDKRNSIPFRYYRTGSPFEYELVRVIYTRYREAEIAR
jgi:phospholipid-binding lipoprotein MlaA